MTASRLSISYVLSQRRISAYLAYVHISSLDLSESKIGGFIPFIIFFKHPIPYEYVKNPFPLGPPSSCC